MSTGPLITVEVTITPLQAEILAKALVTGGEETGAGVALKLADIIDEARNSIMRVPNCSGTTVREWLASRDS